VKPKLVLAAEERLRTKVAADQEEIERFGITKGEALKTLAHYEKGASEEPMNVLRDLPFRAYYAANEALETLGVEVREGNVLSIAMHQANSPRDFWKRLIEGLTK
jgi:hypothetical protein